jgi:hypothetical protein
VSDNVEKRFETDIYIIYIHILYIHIYIYIIYIHTFIHLRAFVGFPSISYCSTHSYGSFEVNNFQFEGVVRFPYLGRGLDNGNKIWIDINSKRMTAYNAY